MKKTVISFILIYLIYISLGIPDSILGISWPTIHKELSIPLYYESVLMVIISVFAACSSILYTKIEKFLKVGDIIYLSCLLTATGLIFINFTVSFETLILAVIPLGFGAGAVDSALNNFVSENLSPKHMIRLHGFWGVGAIIGPLIYSFFTISNLSWRICYATIGFLQIIISIFLFINRNNWENIESNSSNISTVNLIEPKRHEKIIRILFIFIFCGLDVSMNLWLATYIIDGLNISKEIAGIIVSIYFGSIMMGRFLIGMIAEKFKLKSIILCGLGATLLGFTVIYFNQNIVMIGFGVSLSGFGIASVYPFTLYENNQFFNKKAAKELTSYQIAANLIGGLIIPLTIGVLITRTDVNNFLIVELILLVLSIILRKLINSQR